MDLSKFDKFRKPASDPISPIAPAPKPKPTNPLATTTTPVEPPDTFLSGVKGAWGNLNPIPMIDTLGRGLIPEVVGDYIGLNQDKTKVPTGPLNLYQSAIGDPFAKAMMNSVDSFKQGNYAKGALQGTVEAVPLIGPALADAREDMEAGKYFSGTGKALGLGAGFALPKIIPAVKKGFYGTKKIPTVEEIPASYQVEKTYPDAAPRLRAENTMLADALKASPNPEQLLYPQDPLGGFSAYAARDKAIQADIQARAGVQAPLSIAEQKAQLRNQRFMEPSPQQVPAQPGSTRYSVTPRPGPSTELGAPTEGSVIERPIPEGQEGPLYRTIPERLYPRRAQTSMEVLAPDSALKTPEPINVFPPEPPKIGTFPQESGPPVVSRSEPWGKGGKVKLEREGYLDEGVSPFEKVYDPDKPPTPVKTESHMPELLDKFAKTPKKANKEAAKRWATKLQAAQQHGEYYKEDFSDLPEGLDAIHKYQKGERTPETAKVEGLMNELYDAEKAAGITMPKRENYIRQFWKKAPGEELTPAIEGGVIPRKPGFSKPRTYETVEQGIAAGETPKFENMADIIAARVAESKRAVASAEYYKYLEKTGQIGHAKTIRDPMAGAWAYKGPEAKKLQQYSTNVFKHSPSWLRIPAQVVAKTKNVSLTGGIPFTPINIHGLSTARANFYARGMKGAVDSARGIVNPANDVRTLKRTRPLVRKAIDHGYQTSTENVKMNDVENWMAKSKPGRAALKVMKGTEAMWEKPLFEKRLPAAKALILEENYNRLIKKGVSEEKALAQASEISNIFMGGMNKALRSKSGVDALQIIALAPDWAESRIRFGGKQILAAIGKEDPVYAKALARTGALRIGAKAAGVAIGAKAMSDRPSASTSIPMGRTDKESRELPVYETSNELARLPEQVAVGLSQGDISPLTEWVKNRRSIPFTAINNIITNQDAFGDRLSGKDKYGKRIPPGKVIANYAQQATAPLQYPFMKAMAEYGLGQRSGESAISEGLELPFRYRRLPKEQRK